MAALFQDVSRRRHLCGILKPGDVKKGRAVKAFLKHSHNHFARIRLPKTLCHNNFVGIRLQIQRTNNQSILSLARH